MFRNFSEQFFNTRGLAIGSPAPFRNGRGIIMSMQHYKPDQAVLADSCTVFCPECSQKMKLSWRHQPWMGRQHAPTNAPTVTENGLSRPFLDGRAVRFLRSRALIEARDFTILGTICAPECLELGGMTVPQ